MKKIEILKLFLKNFKGIKELDLDFSDITNISGENGTGKTTISDAVSWLLFDKDSQDRVVGDKESNFQIKTYDSNNQIIHGLEHTVTGVINIDGKNTTLTKTYKEKWTKRRGESEKLLTGHETLYYIDEVPVKKSEYQDKINSIVNENIFKLITNPSYFSTNMKWQDRRDILLHIIGDITTDRIINYNYSLKDLESLLAEKDIDVLKKTIAARKKKLNDDIKSIPYRIDELNNSIKEYDWIGLNQELSKNEKDLKDIEDRLLDSRKVAKDTLENQKQLYGLTSKLKAIENEANSNKDKPLFELKEKLQKANFELRTTKNTLDNLIEKKAVYENTIADVTKANDELRAKWHEVNEKILEFDETKFVCPTCNRAFEEHDIESKKAEMTENFNQNKAKELSSIGAKGKHGKSTIEKLKEDIKAIDSKIEVVNADIKEFTTEVKGIEIAIADFKPVDTLSSNKEYQDIKEEIDRISELIKQESEEMTKNNLASTLKDKKKEIVAKIDEIKEQLLAKKNNEDIKDRIQELMDKEKSLAEQIAKIEGQEFLCEDFIKTKVELLESNINDKFKYVKFKLFDTQVNGGLVETCEALIDGVPFSNSNTAAKINAGIDIINTLSDYYKVSAPVIIDNRESVNDIIPCNSQIINLIVSRDKSLKINYGESELNQHLSIVSEEEEKELDELIKKMKSEIGNYTTCIEDLNSFPEGAESVKETILGQSRWSIAKEEVFKYKNQYFAFCYDAPATEMQEGQDTNATVYKVEPIKKEIIDFE